MHGGPGDDLIGVGPGNDRLNVDVGDDAVNGGEGSDLDIFTFRWSVRQTGSKAAGEWR